MDDDLQSLIWQTIDQTISPQDFDRLQDAIESDDHVRSEYLKAVLLSEQLGDIALNNDSADRPQAIAVGEGGAASSARNNRQRKSSWASARFVAVASLLLAIVASGAFWFGRQNTSGSAGEVRSEETDGEDAESLIAGHATLRRAVDVQWSRSERGWREGDVLPDGLFELESGVAEIDFFCGATLLVEGPARLQIESDWSVRVEQGRLRANVPPAARGFVVKAAESEIVDLGTEFAVEVGSESARVHVIDGEIKLRGGELEGKHLLTGESESLDGDSGDLNLAEFSTSDDVSRRRNNAAATRLEKWQRHVEETAADNRLIAYFPMNVAASGRVIPNRADTEQGFDALVLGPVERRLGRFDGKRSGLNFGRTGARVRTRIDGEFDAFTFACWVRIDSLEHRYNALFMGDGYENGEPHWQIRDDGRLMFSVMVDDTQDIRVVNQFDSQAVRDAGLHRVYMTESVWDSSMSGQWLHLVAVYDPIDRSVAQFVDGKQVSRQEIVDRFHISRLRIGPAEIGNWGQPFRTTPWFAVRNLNGTIDEMAIYNAALRSDEIERLYEQGKPLGY